MQVCYTFGWQQFYSMDTLTHDTSCPGPLFQGTKSRNIPTQGMAESARLWSGEYVRLPRIPMLSF